MRHRGRLQALERWVEEQGPADRRCPLCATRPDIAFVRHFSDGRPDADELPTHSAAPCPCGWHPSMIVSVPANEEACSRRAEVGGEL